MESKKSSKPLQVSIPTEIAQEILLKLPVASLLRCKSVCKLWYSLISDTHFIKSHFNSLSNNNNYIYHRIYINSSEESISNGRITETLKYIHVNDVLLYDNASLNAFDFDYLSKVNNPNSNPKNTYISIIFSCNGLLCVSIDNDSFCICNPSIRKSSKKFSLCRRRYRYHVVHGFGYDESSDDYKFVDLSFRCVSEGISYDSLTYIYSLKSGNWKKIDEEFPCGLPLDYSGKYSNGCVHWLNDKDVGWLSNLYTIVYFDLAKESFGEFSLPVMYDEDNNNNEKILTLGDLGGRLCVLFDYNIYGYRADIWVMKVYGEINSWTKLMSISYPGYLRNRTLLNLPIRMCSMPLCMFSDGKVLLHLSSKLFLYDSKNSSFLEIQYNFDWDQSHIIVESLVSPEPRQTLEN